MMKRWFARLVLRIGERTLVAAQGSGWLIRWAADYHCNGTNDTEILQEALDSLGESGGPLLLGGGTFTVNGRLEETPSQS